MKTLLFGLFLASSVVAQTPLQIQNEHLVYGAPKATTTGVEVDVFHLNGDLAFSYSVNNLAKPTLSTTYKDIYNNEHTVTTNCNNYASAEICVKAHKKYLDAMRNAFPAS